MDTAQKQYVVIKTEDTNILISDKEFQEMDIHKLLKNDDIKIKFYNKLPKGIYHFKQLEIEVDKYGDINIIGQNYSNQRNTTHRRG